MLVALGEAIRRARTGAGLSQEALAVDADLDRSYMGGIERGEHNLTVMNIVKIANALKLKPSTLLPDGHPNSPTCGHLKFPHPERGEMTG